MTLKAKPPRSAPAALPKLQALLPALLTLLLAACSAPVNVQRTGAVTTSGGWLSTTPYTTPNTQSTPTPAPAPAPAPTPTPAPLPTPQITTASPFHWCITGAAEPQINRDRTLYAHDTKIFYEHLFGKYPRFYNGQRSNGGIPQLADMTSHLDAVSRTIAREIPDPNWSGFGVIDYESWEPIWERLSSEYKQASIDYLRTQWPTLPQNREEEIAKQRFEDAAKDFMLATLNRCKELRPNAKWGYYGFPRGHQGDNLSWLWEASTALYPSYYFVKAGTDPGTLETATTTPRNNIESAGRWTTKRSVEFAHNDAPVLVFVTFNYHDLNEVYRGVKLSVEDARIALRTPLEAGADGVILWGNTSNAQRASEVSAFLRQVLDPIARRIVQEQSE